MLVSVYKNTTCFVYFLAIAICVGLLVIWRVRGRPNVGSVLCTPTTTNANTNANKIVAEQESQVPDESSQQVESESKRAVFVPVLPVLVPDESSQQVESESKRVV